MTCWHAPYVGRPFDERGDHLWHCWQLVRTVLLEQKGIDLPGYGEISATDLAAVVRAMRDGQTSEWADPWLPVEKPRAFDVVLMRVRALVGHVGIMVDEKRMLHVERACHSCVVETRHFSVAGRIAGYRRHRSLA